MTCLSSRRIWHSCHKYFIYLENHQINGILCFFIPFHHVNSVHKTLLLRPKKIEQNMSRGSFGGPLSRCCCNGLRRTYFVISPFQANPRGSFILPAETNTRKIKPKRHGNSANLDYSVILAAVDARRNSTRG